MKYDWQKLSIEQVANVVAEHLSNRGLDVTLVGGACVSIYSANAYQSLDVDFVSDAPIRKIDAVMAEIDFQRKSTRHYEHQDCKYIIEFIPSPVAIGRQPISSFDKKHTRFGSMKLLTPTDCVKDRLAAFFHWNDYPSLDQALLVATRQKNKVSINEIMRWAEEEDKLDKFKIFLKKLGT